MKRYDILKKGDGWVAESDARIMARARTKRDAVRFAAAAAKQEPEPVTVKIHNRDGRISEERTYPRGADARATKG
jgi:Uncharacterized protein conserved in bacteria (DUF2188)